MKFYFSNYFFLEKKVAKIQGCETMAKNYGGKPTIGKLASKIFCIRCTSALEQCRWLNGLRPQFF
jgi:hypothetical protein